MALGLYLFMMSVSGSVLVYSNELFEPLRRIRLSPKARERV